MTWKALKQQTVAAYHPALVAEKVISFVMRRRIHSVLNWLTALSGFTTLLLAPGLKLVPLATVGVLDIRLLGVFFICLVLWIVSACFRALHYYYADERYELAMVLYHSHEVDPVKYFLKSGIGQELCVRFGASPRAVTEFLQHRPVIVSARSLSCAGVDGVVAYVRMLLKADATLDHFFASFGVTDTDVVAGLRWVLERRVTEINHERWWSREQLGRIRGIGKTWHYGRLFMLEKFMRPLPPRKPFFYGDKELLALENLLRRSEQANAFLVGDNLEEKLSIISELAQLMTTGRVMPELEHKQLVVLDTDALVSAADSMSSFERLVHTLGTEAATVGNVVLVFIDFPAFITAGEQYGLDVTTMLDPFFTAPELRIVALSTERNYQILIERSPALSQRFGEVFLEETGAAGTLRVLQQAVVAVEKRAPILFTYQALRALEEAGDRYVVSGIQPEKSLNILYELVPKITATQRGLVVVSRQDVEHFMHLKTGIPMGVIDEGERAKLLGLEKLLQQHIIGQDEAVRAVAAAVRRARSGINNPARPLASFLFLGPTGVGKTETTKVLAEVFFGVGAAGGEAGIARLDMSEYSAADALEKLIGQAAGAPGILADMVREHPYGVLLLDEFEKTTPEVENLFLQILDEGFFSDGEGKKVNCRNLLIVATSNAGADLIWDAVRAGKDLSHAREIILETIIHRSIFRPELLNRFDGIIVFHPLGSEQLAGIARLQLQKLVARLADRGVRLVITDELLQFVVQFGTDPKFGARPMARAIQDTVEQAVADKIIAGNLKPGDDITLSLAELTAARQL